MIFTKQWKHCRKKIPKCKFCTLESYKKALNMKDKRIYGMFGPKIKAMRLEQGLKQRQLAELLGTDMPMYSKMELGARRVRRDMIPKLAELYKVNEYELMTLWLADAVYATLKSEEKTLQLDAIDLAKEYFKNDGIL
jgi:transcriptional regulator with XRE-family HTH domain